MSLRPLLLAAAMLPLAAAPAAAQRTLVDDAFGASFALRTTPDGAVVPLALDGGSARPVLSLRTGASRLTETGRGGHAWAASLDVPYRWLRGGLTVGYLDRRCASSGPTFSLECQGALSYGARLGTGLPALELGRGTALLVRVEASAGHSNAPLYTETYPGGSIETRLRATTATIGLPIGVTLRRGRLTLSPHLTPRVGYGQLTLALSAGNPVTFRDAHWLLGGGVGVGVGERFGVDVGFQRIEYRYDEALYGVALRYRL